MGKVAVLAALIAAVIVAYLADPPSAQDVASDQREEPGEGVEALLEALRELTAQPEAPVEEVRTAQFEAPVEPPVEGVEPGDGVAALLEALRELTVQPEAPVEEVRTVQFEAPVEEERP